MKKLTDFANIAQLQTYIKDWNSLTGLSAAITDLDGNCLTTAIPESCSTYHAEDALTELTLGEESIGSMLYALRQIIRMILQYLSRFFTPCLLWRSTTSMKLLS